MNSYFFLVENSSLKIWYLTTRLRPRDGVHSINQSGSRQGKFRASKRSCKVFWIFPLEHAYFWLFIEQNSAQVAQKIDNFNLNPIMPAERISVTLG